MSPKGLCHIIIVIERLLDRIRLLLVHDINQRRHFGWGEEVEEGFGTFLLGYGAYLSRIGSSLLTLFLVTSVNVSA